MFKNALIGVGIAGALALGMGGAAAPAEAKVYIYVGSPGYYHGYRHHHGYCRSYWVKKWSPRLHRYVKVRRTVCR